MVCGNETTACGWDELFSGDLIGAAYSMYTDAMGLFFITVLFFVYQFLILYKTRNVTLMWVTGVLFATLFATATFVDATAVPIILVVLALELAGIMYYWVFK